MTQNPVSQIVGYVKIELLKQQLEQTRFERALEVSESLAQHRALLTTAELARLNQIISGKNSDPWRHEPVTLTLPSGRVETLTLITDPLLTARDKLHRATETAEAGATLESAIEIYIGLVMAHVFVDANRRTAALASHYFLKRYGSTLTGIALHQIGLGDLRQEGQIEEFRATVHQMAKFTQKTQHHSS